MFDVVEPHCKSVLETQSTTVKIKIRFERHQTRILSLPFTNWLH